MSTDLRAKTCLCHALLEDAFPEAAARRCHASYHATCATILCGEPPRRGSCTACGQPTQGSASPAPAEATIQVGHHITTILRHAYLRPGSMATALATWGSFDGGLPIRCPD